MKGPINNTLGLSSTIRGLAGVSPAIAPSLPRSWGLTAPLLSRLERGRASRTQDFHEFNVEDQDLVGAD